MAASANDDIQEKPERRPQFGQRFLEDPDAVFQHNAWDNVTWDDEQKSEADRVIATNSSKLVDSGLAEKYDTNASDYWDKFYSQHQAGFFKDRNWLFTEFPELATYAAPNSENDVHQQDFVGAGASRRILEVGCGVGNTVFPLLEANNDPNMFVYCCDFSSQAISILKTQRAYDENRCFAFVCDISSDNLSMPFPENSLDIITLVFVLSAINPSRMKRSIANLARFLKPNGLILFRDYGRYDLTQLRFKNGRCISENFYVRGDGTRVYFFMQEELDEIFSAAGLVKDLNHIDRRLQVNRGKLLKMYRVWIQCKYRKPV